MPLVFGYAGVSTDRQTLDAQVAQLEVAVASGSVGKVFREKVSGAARDRPQLARLVASLSPGDVVLVTRIDRLARSTRDLSTCWRLWPTRGPRSARLAIRGPTPPRRMGG